MKIRHLRWWLCGLMFLATALSFLDRQVLSVVAPVVTKEFGMSNQAYSYVTTAFLVSYAGMFFLAGRVMDVIGTRLGMTLSVGLWSLGSALHATARSAMQLGVFRFVLGAGEGGCFPGVAKGATEWFPQRERALAIGIAIGGASLGGVAAPPLTVWIVAMAGWRGAFLATGLIGALWVVAWWILYHAPGRSPLVTDEERALIEAGNRSAHVSADAPSVVELLGRKEVWGMAGMRFIFDPVFYLYMFWIPQYLSQDRGLSLAEIGRLTWIPFLALGVSNVVGGWLSDRLIAGGMSSLKARKLVMAGAALLTISSSTAASAGSVAVAIAIMSLLMFAHGFWITNYVTVISEVFDRRSVATVMGLTGMVGTLGGMTANTAIGFVADHFGFLPVWIASGCLYPLALVVLLITVRQKKPSGV
jgi:ACS family hexuronate transporter-like MFS transporter